MASELQNEIDRLKSGLQANTSATQGMVDLMTKFAADVREAADDPDEVRAVADGYEANTAALVAALAANTPASSEPAPTVPETTEGTGAVDGGGPSDAGTEGEDGSEDNV